MTDDPTLRAVLDANIDHYPEALIPSLRNEQRMLAVTAGLAEPHEPAHEASEIGAAFMALLRHRDTQPTAHPSSQVGQLLRLLAPSA